MHSHLRKQVCTKANEGLLLAKKRQRREAIIFCDFMPLRLLIYVHSDEVCDATKMP